MSGNTKLIGVFKKNKHQISKCLRIFYLFLLVNSSVYPIYASDKNKCGKVCFFNRNLKRCILVEVADDPQARERGLMFRESLEKFEGMLFLFETDAQYSLWMKNMRFPLDFIWIDSEKKIVEITQNVPICTVDNCPVYSASVPIRYVLEVPAGFVKRYGISEGDTVTISP